MPASFWRLFFPRISTGSEPPHRIIANQANKEIKSDFPKLPIIAFTAYSTESDKQLAFKNGCDDFISKPISDKAFTDLIHKYLLLM